MPKLKSHRGAAKRVKRTGTGKFKRHHAYHSHILTKKSRKRKRKLRSSATLFAEAGRGSTAGQLMEALLARCPEFVKAYEPDGLTVDEFAAYGATARTLRSFVSGYWELVGTIDRVDVARDGSPVVAVVDYKTGVPPAARQVANTSRTGMLSSGSFSRRLKNSTPALVVW